MADGSRDLSVRKKPQRTAPPDVRPTELFRLIALAAVGWSWMALAFWLNRVSLTSGVTRWDGQWYLSVYGSGYRVDDLTYVTQQNVAFFPGISWTARVVDNLIPRPEVYVVSGAMWGFAAVIAAGLAARRLGIRPSVTVTWILLYPGFFFIFAFYSEGLAIAASAMVFVALSKRSVWLAVLAGVFVGVSRPVVLAAVAMMSATMLRSRESDARSVAAAGFGTATGLGLVIFAQHRGGDGLGFLRAQRAWDRTLEYPFSAMVDEFQRVLHEPFRAGLVWNPVVIVLAVVMVIWMAADARRGDWSWGLVVFSAVVVLIQASTSSIGGQIRFVMSAWPVFLFLGHKMSGVRLSIRAGLAVPSVLVGFWWMSIFADGTRFLA